MKKIRTIQNVAIIVLAVAIICMSVGYATFATPFDVSGTTTIERSSWDVHFSNPTKLASSNVLDSAITGPTLSNGATSLTFAVDLKLNETYEFSIDVTNGGTLAAELSTFTLTGTKGNETVLNASTGLSYASKYLKYVVTYDDGTPLKANDLLPAGTSKKLKVSVKYVEPENPEDLPETSETYVFTLNLNYTQAD